MERFLSSLRGRLRRSAPPAPDGPAPTDAPVLWIADAEPTAAAAAEAIARAAQELCSGLEVIFTTAAEAPPDTVTLPRPEVADRTAARDFITRRRPGCAVFFTSTLLTPVLTAAVEHDLPFVLVVDSTLPRNARPQLRRALFAACIGTGATESAQRAGLPDARIASVVALDPPRTPPGCNATERDDFASLFLGRPIWLADRVTANEEPLVIQAHAEAARLAHRLLLILVPQDASRGPELARRLRAQGWRVASRAEDEEPDEETQIFLADTEGESGLWLRLAPVTFLGGSLDPQGKGSVDPSDAAALGSAIIHGPRHDAQGALIERLSAARATRPVRDPAGLARALQTLSAPDAAAEQAHAAWLVVSESAGAISTLAETIAATLAAPPGAP